MNLSLERPKRTLLAVNADVAVILITGDDAICRDLLVSDVRIVEQSFSFNVKKDPDCGKEGQVAINGDQIHQTIRNQ
jgi:hypothetical protein